MKLKNRLLIICILMIMLFIPIISASICCKKDTDCVISEVCQDGNCDTCKISIYANNGSNIVNLASMDNSTNFIYLYNIGKITDFGYYPYSINCTNGEICSGDCAVEVKDDCGDTDKLVVWIYIISIISAVCMILIYHTKQESSFAVIAGFLFCILGINLWINGYPNLTSDFLKNAISIILTGIGFIYIVSQFSGGD